MVFFFESEYPFSLFLPSSSFRPLSILPYTPYITSRFQVLPGMTSTLVVVVVVLLLIIIDTRLDIMVMMHQRIVFFSLFVLGGFDLSLISLFFVYLHFFLVLINGFLYHNFFIGRVCYHPPPPPPPLFSSTSYLFFLFSVLLFSFSCCFRRVVLFLSLSLLFFSF